jgi:hypothetical protein
MLRVVAICYNQGDKDALLETIVFQPSTVSHQFSFLFSSSLSNIYLRSLCHEYNQAG